MFGHLWVTILFCSVLSHASFKKIEVNSPIRHLIMNCLPIVYCICKLHSQWMLCLYTFLLPERGEWRLWHQIYHLTLGKVRWHRLTKDVYLKRRWREDKRLNIENSITEWNPTLTCTMSVFITRHVCCIDRWKENCTSCLFKTKLRPLFVHVPHSDCCSWLLTCLSLLCGSCWARQAVKCWSRGNNETENNLS